MADSYGRFLKCPDLHMAACKNPDKDLSFPGWFLFVFLGEMGRDKKSEKLSHLVQHVPILLEDCAVKTFPDTCHHSSSTPKTHNVANGTRGIVVGWQFPPNTTFDDFCYHGVQACLPSAPVDCVYVQVTNVRLKKRAPNQPPGLPANVICLPRITVQVDDPVALPANVSHRKSIRLKIKQVPLRQAIVLTTYSIQGVQFSKYIIAETAPKSMYVQMSRGTEGVASFTLRRHLDKAFAKAASPSAALAAEMSRLQSPHETTKGRFDELGVYLLKPSTTSLR